MIIIPAFLGSTNSEELTFTDKNGAPIDFVARGALAAKLFAGGSSIDCTLGANGKVTFVPGDLNIKTMDHSAILKVYAAGDTKGEVIAGPGLPASITIKMNG